MFHTNVLQKIKTHFILSSLFFSEIHFIHDIMWENMIEPGTSQMTIQWTRKRYDLPAGCLRSEHRHTKNIRCLLLFHDKLLRHTYIACLLNVQYASLEHLYS